MVLAHTFVTELRENHDVDEGMFQVNGATSLQTACDRQDLDCRYEQHGNRSSVEHIIQKVKRRTSSFSNSSSHAETETGDKWLQSFAFAWN